MSRRSGTTGTNNSGFSRFSYSAVVLIGIVLTALIPYFFFIPFVNTKVYWLTLLFTALLIIGGLLLRNARSFVERRSHLFWVGVLILLCLGIKLFWVLRYRIEPLVDFRTFYQTARGLAKPGLYLNSRYIALFPHIFGYSFFLSLFFRFFGTGTIIAPLVNVLLTCVSLLLLYYICYRLFSKSAAVAAGLIWIIYPSQTIYNMFVLSEPLYTALILGVLAFVIACDKNAVFSKSFFRIIGSAAIVAAILAAINAVRPIALILAISLFILYFFLKPVSFSNKKLFRNKCIYFAVLFVLYFAFTSLTNRFIASEIGEKPATTPGYSLYVGFNEKTYGRFSKADSDLLLTLSGRPGWSAQDAQREMLNRFKGRITSGSINFTELMHRKYEFLWNEDINAINYMKSILADQNDLDLLTIACNAFYQFTVIMSCVALAFIWKRRENPAALLFPLYMIGLSAAQMLVEVAGRYHYSGIIVFTVLTAYALSVPAKKAR